MALKLDYSKALAFLPQEELAYQQPMIATAHHMVHERTGAGSDYLGWVDLPTTYDREEFQRIQKAAQTIQNHSDALVVIGIGGSYLGAKAALDMLNHTFYNQLPKSERQA